MFADEVTWGSGVPKGYLDQACLPPASVSHDMTSLNIWEAVATRVSKMIELTNSDVRPFCRDVYLKRFDDLDGRLSLKAALRSMMDLYR